MEHTLRCNAMKCRKELNELAVVTTCRYINCISSYIYIYIDSLLAISSALNAQKPSDNQIPLMDNVLRALLVKLVG